MNIAFTLPFAVIVIGAFLAVTRSNILHAVFGLAISLVGVAGAFLALGSPFTAVMEVLIYVGGIAVTMIFAVMLSSVSSPAERGGFLRKSLAALVAGLFLAGGSLIIVNADFGAGNHLSTDAWSIQAVGRDLLDRFNLAFESLSLVLLLAIVGAIVIVRREPVLPADQDDAPEEEAA